MYVESEVQPLVYSNLERAVGNVNTVLTGGASWVKKNETCDPLHFGIWDSTRNEERGH